MRIGGRKGVNLQRYLDAADYPAVKADLVNRAEERGAADDVLLTLEELPEEEEYATPADAGEAIARLVEPHRRVRVIRRFSDTHRSLVRRWDTGRREPDSS